MPKKIPPGYPGETITGCQRSSMGLEVIVVCGINVLIFLVLLRSLPLVWGIRSALLTTAEKMNGWSEEAEAALGPTPAQLLKLRQTLQNSKGTLTRTQKQVMLLGTLVGLGRWILKRNRTPT